MENNTMGFGTRSIHGGIHLADSCRALNTPIYQNATYSFETCAQGGRYFAGEEKGYIYTRLGNPTTNVLESRVASLEQAQACASFSSGMGAISSVMWTICRAGVHIVADATLYGCTFAMLEHGATRYGVDVQFIDMSDLKQLESALKETTAMVYFETPANPNMKILDIESIATIAHKYNENIKVVCDNTFATPYLQLPLTLGCDIVVHSATKYLNGHGDVIAGFACGTEEFISELKIFGLKDMTGAVQSPMDSFLVLRGLKTLEIRMERHCDNTEKLLKYLQTKPQVIKIYYPGLPEHPNYEICKKQMKRPGAMLAFEVEGGMLAGAKLLDNLKLCTLAVSLGDAETLVEHPASMTHSAYTQEERAASGIPEGLVRVSAGLENIEDIIADFEQSFANL